MADEDRWFRLPNETVDGGAEDRPDHLHGDQDPDQLADGISGFAGNKRHPDGSPVWAVRVYGTTAALDDLASRDGAVELSRTDAGYALDRMDSTGGARSIDEWESTIRSGGA